MFDVLLMQVHTVGVGVAIGQSCMLLSAGTKGKRFMLPHATGMSLPVSTACCCFPAKGHACFVFWSCIICLSTMVLV